MKDHTGSVKLCIVLVYIAMIVMAALAVLCPFIVRWYVEKKERDPNLATTIMIVFYPCVPFIAAFLISLKRILSNIKAGLIVGEQNSRLMKIITICCACAAVIMVIGGFQYMPFWVSGLSAAAGALLTAVLRNTFDTASDIIDEKENYVLRSNYEKDSNICNR